MPFRSEEQRRWMWANKPKMAKKWTDEHGSTPVKAKKGKYEEFKHPQHDILPLEHMEESVSSQERIERLLDKRKKKKLLKAAEGELVREKTRGTGIAVSGDQHYVMKGMDAAQAGKLVQVPTRGTGAAVSGDQHYVMEGMDAAKTGKMIKAKESKYIQKKSDAKQGLEYTNWILKSDKSLYGHKIEKRPSSKWDTVKPKKTIIGGDKPDTWDTSLKHMREIYKIAKENKKGDRLTASDLENARKMIKSRKLAEVDPGAPYKTGGPIKAKKGVFSGAATSMYDKPPGWDVKKISDKTHKKLTKLWKHREAGGWKSGAGKQYKKYLKSLKKVTTKTKVPSTFLERRKQLAGPSSNIPISKKAKYFKDMIKTVGVFPKVKSKSFHFKDATKPSDFLKRRMTLSSMRTLPASAKALLVARKLVKRTGLGKAVAAATVVAGAYEAGKRKLFSVEKPSNKKLLKDWFNVKDKKKVDKKSIGGETVVMKSGGGYIDELL